MTDPRPLPTLRWIDEPGKKPLLRLIDQVQLPERLVELECRSVEDVWQAIARLAVRGAPAIGAAAAYGVCLALAPGQVTPDAWVPAGGAADQLASIEEACDHLATSRPTAVNLFWALDRMRRAAQAAVAAGESLPARLLVEAQAIEAEDRATCAAIGQQGADWLSDLPAGSSLLTHCNAGALATAGEGTALAVVFELARRGYRPHVWVDETRPLLQGARLTAWELMQRGIACTLICDNMAPVVMQQGKVQAIITGADRIAANGDAANKIGTYGLAVQAAAHDIPFYIAAPRSTFDLSLAHGDAIPIEERSSDEITCWGTRRTSPAGVACYNPAFDVTPARLIRGIITEMGVIASPDVAGVAAAVGTPAD